MNNEELLELDAEEKDIVLKENKKYRKTKHLIKDKIKYYKSLFFGKTNKSNEIALSIKSYRVETNILIKDELGNILKEIPFNFMMKDWHYNVSMFKVTLPEINTEYDLSKKSYIHGWYLKNSIENKLSKIISKSLEKSKKLSNLKNRFYLKIVDIKERKPKLIHQRMFEYEDGYGCQIRKSKFKKSCFGAMESKKLYIHFPDTYKDDDFLSKEEKRNCKFNKYKKQFFEQEEVY